MYIDDWSFILSLHARSMQCLIEDLDNFSGLSEQKRNYDKCVMLRIGSLKKTITLPCSSPIKWADSEVDILGIHITKYTNELSTINFNRKQIQIDMILKLWRDKYLSIYVKITMIKSLVISHFTHLWHCLLLMIRFSNHSSKILFALSGMLNQTSI
jgi:hypothetical protein